MNCAFGKALIRGIACYRPIENQIVPMTDLVAKPYSARASGRGECLNNGRQALPLLVRPRFLPGDQKGFGALQLFLVKRSKRDFKSRLLRSCQNRVTVTRPRLRAVPGDRS